MLSDEEIINLNVAVLCGIIWANLLISIMWYSLVKCNIL